MIKKAKPKYPPYDYYDMCYLAKDIIVERNSIAEELMELRGEWGTTKGYERLKEIINEVEAKQ